MSSDVNAADAGGGGGGVMPGSSDIPTRAHALRALRNSMLYQARKSQAEKDGRPAKPLILRCSLCHHRTSSYCVTCSSDSAGANPRRLFAVCNTHGSHTRSCYAEHINACAISGAHGGGRGGGGGGGGGGGNTVHSTQSFDLALLDFQEQVRAGFAFGRSVCCLDVHAFFQSSWC